MKSQVAPAHENQPLQLMTHLLDKSTNTRGAISHLSEGDVIGGLDSRGCTTNTQMAPAHENQPLQLTTHLLDKSPLGRKRVKRRFRQQRLHYKHVHGDHS